MPKYQPGDEVKLFNGETAVVTGYKTSRPKYPYSITKLASGKHFRCGELHIVEKIGERDLATLPGAVPEHPSTLGELVLALQELLCSGAPKNAKVAVARDEECNGFNRLWSVEYDAEAGLAFIHVADDLELANL